MLILLSLSVSMHVLAPLPAGPESRPILSWAATYKTGRGSMHVRDAAFDEHGAVYLVGIVSGVVDFDPGPEVDARACANCRSHFVSKFGPDRDYEWTVTFGGDQDFANSLCLTGNNELLVAGSLGSTIDFDPGRGVDQRELEGTANAFVLRLSPKGAYLGAVVFGTGSGDSRVSAGDLALNKNGDYYITGLLDGTADFDPGPSEQLHSSNQSTPDAHTTKFHADGSHAWTRVIGGRAFDGGQQLEVDGQGSVYVAGEIRGTVDLDPGPGIDTFTTKGVSAMFITKYDSDGNYLWTRPWDVPISPQGKYLTRTQAGDLYLVGVFTGTFDFDPTAGQDWRSGVSDGFVSSIDSNGNYRWTQIFSGNGPGFVFPLRVDADESDGVLISGTFTVSADFDPGEGVDSYSTPGTAHRNAFIVKLTSDGLHQWTRIIGAARDFGNAFATNGTIYLVAGSGPEDSDLDPGCLESIQGPFSIFWQDFVIELACMEGSSDFNEDGQTDLSDAASFPGRLIGPSPAVCGPGCPTFDFNSDDDIDLSDFARFQVLFGAR